MGPCSGLQTRQGGKQRTRLGAVLVRHHAVGDIQLPDGSHDGRRLRTTPGLRFGAIELGAGWLGPWADNSGHVGTRRLFGSDEALHLQAAVGVHRMERPGLRRSTTSNRSRSTSRSTHIWRLATASPPTTRTSKAARTSSASSSICLVRWVTTSSRSSSRKNSELLLPSLATINGQPTST